MPARAVHARDDLLEEKVIAGPTFGGETAQEK